MCRTSDNAVFRANRRFNGMERESFRASFQPKNRRRTKLVSRRVQARVVGIATRVLRVVVFRSASRYHASVLLVSRVSRATCVNRVLSSRLVSRTAFSRLGQQGLRIQVPRVRVFGYFKVNCLVFVVFPIGRVNVRPNTSLPRWDVTFFNGHLVLRNWDRFLDHLWNSRVPRTRLEVQTRVIRVRHIVLRAFRSTILVTVPAFINPNVDGRFLSLPPVLLRRLVISQRLPVPMGLRSASRLTIHHDQVSFHYFQWERKDPRVRRPVFFHRVIRFRVARHLYRFARGGQYHRLMIPGVHTTTNAEARAVRRTFPSRRVSTEWAGSHLQARYYRVGRDDLFSGVEVDQFRRNVRGERHLPFRFQGLECSYLNHFPNVQRPDTMVIPSGYFQPDFPIQRVPDRMRDGHFHATESGYLLCHRQDRQIFVLLSIPLHRFTVDAGVVPGIGGAVVPVVHPQEDPMNSPFCYLDNRNRHSVDQVVLVCPIQV